MARKARYRICLFLLFSAAGSAAILRVGPDREYATPCRALEHAAAGDTIEIDGAGNYDGDVCGWSIDDLTIKGVNGRPKIDAAGQSFRGRATWMISGKNTTVENIELSGAEGPAKNGAAIWQMGTNLTVRKCYIHGNQDGILAGDNPDSHIAIEMTEFAGNGYSDGYSHNIYINHVAQFTLKFSYSHDSISGHLVKSRARENFILYNRLTGESGTSSLELDLPNGGRSYVIGNVIEQGASTENSTIVAYGMEGLTNPDSALFFVNNTVVNDRWNGTFLKMARDAPPAVVQNNIFSGHGTTTDQPNARLSRNVTSGALFVDPAEYDYHLRAGSYAHNAGSDPGAANGYPLMPKFQYVHPACFEIRKSTGATLDAGAFGTGGGVDASCATLAGLSKLTLSVERVEGGGTVTGMVRLTGPAAEGGLTLTLSSSDSAVAAAPASVTIPMGGVSAAFKIVTSNVAQTTPVMITAGLGPDARSVKLTIESAPTAISLAIPATALGGRTITATVSIANPSATEEMRLVLMSIPSEVAQLASSITVPAGALKASFPIRLASVTVNTHVTIGVAYGGVTKTVTLTVTPLRP